MVITTDEGVCMRRLRPDVNSLSLSLFSTLDGDCHDCMKQRFFL